MRQWLVNATVVSVIALASLQPAPAAAQTATGPAVTKPAKVHHMTAKVVKADPEAKTLVVTHHRWRMQREVTFTVAPEAAGALGDLKPGDRVRITYERVAGKLTALSIAAAGQVGSKS